MPTIKKRINITLSQDLEEALSSLASRDKVPEATKAVELLKSAILIEEDIMLARIAKDRDTKDAKFVTHEEAWGGEI